MGIRLRWTIWTGVAVAAAVVSSAGVLAQTIRQPPSNVSGFEIAATSTDGQFVGSIGTGTELAGGYFYANVIHQVLQESPASAVTTAICGMGESTTDPPPCSNTNESGNLDEFSRVTVYLPTGESITGTFAYADQGIVFKGNSGGTGSCPWTQTFSVADVVEFGNEYGSYEFSVTLTHYSYDFFGDCITYFATISGTMTPKSSN